jgi:hypothetical protein
MKLFILSIREIRRRYNADRVYIWQFHNGGKFLYQRTDAEEFQLLMKETQMD